MSASKDTFPQRIITSQPLAGTVIDVDVSTYVAGTVKYDNGAIGTIFTTFDVKFPREISRFIEVYGTEGTLFVPDPRTASAARCGCSGPRTGTLREVPLMYDYPENSRALAWRIWPRPLATGREARCDYRQTFHVLEIIEGFETSSRDGRWVKMQSHYDRKPPMKKNPLKGILD